MSSSIKHNSDESLDTIKDIKLLQAHNGYRFSVDALLLENFINSGAAEQGIELGAGSGIISILLARRLMGVRIKAVEIQDTLAERATRNVNLNGVDDSVEVLSKDMLELKKVFKTNSFDFAFSNPPFRKPDTGKISNGKERAVARHEIAITLPELIKTASYLLKHSGRFYLIYHPFRLTELIETMRNSRLEPKRMRFVHSREGEEAKMVLVEALKGAGTWLKVEPPLYIHERDNQYTNEVESILGK